MFSFTYDRNFAFASAYKNHTSIPSIRLSQSQNVTIKNVRVNHPINISSEINQVYNSIFLRQSVHMWLVENSALPWLVRCYTISWKQLQAMKIENKSNNLIYAQICQDLVGMVTTYSAAKTSVQESRLVNRHSYNAKLVDQT